MKLQVLYVVRHRQAYSGDHGELTQEGTKKAKLLAGFFSGIKNAKVVSSNRGRCKDTAIAIVNKAKVPLQVENVFTGYYDWENDWTVDFLGSVAFVKNYSASRTLIVVAHSDHVANMAKLLNVEQFTSVEKQSNFGGDMIRINFQKKTITRYV